MEPPYYFVRDSGSRAAHHWDYEGDRPTRALCGHRYEGEIVFEGAKRPGAVCRACQEILPRFEARWWRETAHESVERYTRLQERCSNAERDVKLSRSQIEKLTYQLGLANGRIEMLAAKVANQRKNLRELQSARTVAKRAAKVDPAGKKTVAPATPMIQRKTVIQPKPH